VSLECGGGTYTNRAVREEIIFVFRIFYSVYTPQFVAEVWNAGSFISMPSVHLLTLLFEHSYISNHFYLYLHVFKYRVSKKYKSKLHVKRMAFSDYNVMYGSINYHCKKLRI
jgi:hypothetical protein